MFTRRRAGLAILAEDLACEGPDLETAMIRAKLLLFTCAAALTSGDAAAQSYGQPARGQYGGGFIELLMTGRDAGPALRDTRPVAPQAARHRAIESDGLIIEESVPSSGRSRVAALPANPEEVLPRRAASAEHQRQMVPYAGREAPGTIVIDTPGRFLYLVQGDGQALRYGIGVGRPGFTWAGMKSVTRKAEWPSWTPPAQMLKRRPDLPRFMAGGPDNPLGARALYLGSSLYRIHGTNEPHTIGQNVSSGCIRMMNEDVVDLYERVRVGTRVKVI
jgi:lipoprotein-anchoring transpeptidase ErfK/SrfK